MINWKKLLKSEIESTYKVTEKLMDLMVEHLKQHKGQLFYYLMLQGKPVNTGNLWGM